MRKNIVNSLYDEPVPELKKLLTSAVNKGLSRGSGKATLFFRADDIGVPSHSFSKMVKMFQKYSLPLCLAVVPTWLTPVRWQSLQRITGKTNLFCWHQHGWNHTNHETSGKKQEFGESRAMVDLQSDLIRGRDRLSLIMGDSFFPFFTPPWNRCGATTLDLLQNYNYYGISRSSKANPPSPPDLSDIQINVDLHTRKETDRSQALHNLLLELETSISLGCSGIMLHHQRSNDNGFLLLKNLMEVILDSPKVEPVTFQELLR